MPSVSLKPGREKSLLRRHPWVFWGAIASVDGHPASGETVTVLGHDGAPQGQGAFSPLSQIAVRMWSFDERPVDADYFRARLWQALGLRLGLLARPNLNAMRLV